MSTGAHLFVCTPPSLAPLWHISASNGWVPLTHVCNRCCGSSLVDNEQLQAGHLYLDSSRMAAAQPSLAGRSPGRVSILGAKMNTVGRLLNATEYYGSLLYGQGMWFEGAMPSWLLQVSRPLSLSLSLSLCLSLCLAVAHQCVEPSRIAANRRNAHEYHTAGQRSLGR